MILPVFQLTITALEWGVSFNVHLTASYHQILSLARLYFMSKYIPYILNQYD